jgi:hypothetical protein
MDMPLDAANFSRAFSFVLRNGAEVFPVKMRSRATGRSAFRVSPGGTGGNKLDVTEQVEEGIMIGRVLDEGYAVRCSTLDGSLRGQYRQGGRSVVALKQYKARPF